MSAIAPDGQKLGGFHITTPGFSVGAPRMEHAAGGRPGEIGRGTFRDHLQAALLPRLSIEQDPSERVVPLRNDLSRGADLDQMPRVHDTQTIAGRLERAEPVGHDQGAKPACVAAISQRREQSSLVR